MDACTPVPGDETPRDQLAVPAAWSSLPDGTSDESQHSLSGLAVFLFCDVRGYTDFTRRNGAEAASELVGRLVAMAHAVADEHHGTLRGTWGDPEQARTVTWPLTMRIGRKSDSPVDL